MAAHEGLGRLGVGEELSVVQVERPGYEHLRAFDEVAVSLVDGLASVGFDAELVRGGPVPGRRNIMLGAHVLDTRQLLELPTDTIIYNHEQIDGSSMMPPDRLDAFARLHRWDYSRRNVESWEAAGLAASHVPIGWSPTLRTVEQGQPKQVDVFFFGSLNERRRAVLQALEDAGARVRVGFGSYGRDRDAVIARSRLVINIQFYEARILEMVRLSHLFANGVPVVSETAPDLEMPPELTDAAIFAEYDDLVAATLEALGDPQELEEVGARGRRRMEEQPWRRCLEAVLPERCSSSRSGTPTVAPPARRAGVAPLSPFGVVVLGMHRSGTSALTEALVGLGLSPGERQYLLGATPSNPRGHFEPAPLVQANDLALRSLDRYWHAPTTDRDALREAGFDRLREDIRSAFGRVFPEHGWVYKDPRLCVLWPLYEALFPLPPMGVFVARAPEAVAASLHRRDRMSVSHALQLWEYYNRVALESLTTFSHRVVLTHELLMTDPRWVVEELAHAMSEVGMEVDSRDLARACSSVDPQLVTVTSTDSKITPTKGQQRLWSQIVEMAASGVAQVVEPPSDELRTAMDRRADLVNANIRSLQLGWLEPTTDLHRPE